MLTNLLQYGALGSFLLRLAMALIFNYHGIPKVSKPEQMALGLGWPSMAVRALGIVEIVSSVWLIFGIYTQFAALALAFVMIGAIYMKVAKWKIPFWSHDNTGWEFDFILLAVAIFFLTHA